MDKIWDIFREEEEKKKSSVWDIFEPTTATTTMPEAEFQKAYKEMATEQGLSLDPDDPKHFYDYRALYKETGKLEPDKTGHFPSKFKLEGHPRMVVGGVDTKTGEPTDKPLTLQMLSSINLNYNPPSSALIDKIKRYDIDIKKLEKEAEIRGGLKPELYSAYEQIIEKYNKAVKEYQTSQPLVEGLPKSLPSDKPLIEGLPVSKPEDKPGGATLPKPVEVPSYYGISDVTTPEKLSKVEKGIIGLFGTWEAQKRAMPELQKTEDLAREVLSMRGINSSHEHAQIAYIYELLTTTETEVGVPMEETIKDIQSNLEKYGSISPPVDWKKAWKEEGKLKTALIGPSEKYGKAESVRRGFIDIIIKKQSPGTDFLSSLGWAGMVAIMGSQAIAGLIDVTPKIWNKLKVKVTNRTIPYAEGREAMNKVREPTVHGQPTIQQRRIWDELIKKADVENISMVDMLKKGFTITEVQPRFAFGGKLYAGVPIDEMVKSIVEVGKITKDIANQLKVMNPVDTGLVFQELSLVSPAIASKLATQFVDLMPQKITKIPKVEEEMTPGEVEQLERLKETKIVPEEEVEPTEAELKEIGRPEEKLPILTSKFNIEYPIHYFIKSDVVDKFTDAKAFKDNIEKARKTFVSKELDDLSNYNIEKDFGSLENYYNWVKDNKKQIENIKKQYKSFVNELPVDDKTKALWEKDPENLELNYEDYLRKEKPLTPKEKFMARMEEIKAKVEPKKLGEKFTGKAFRAETIIPEHGAEMIAKMKTAKEKLDYDYGTTGNEIFKNAEKIAEELGIDVSKIPIKELTWIAPDIETAEKYGEAKEIKLPEDTIILAKDEEGGFLVLKNVEKYKVEPTPIPVERVEVKPEEPKIDLATPVQIKKAHAIANTKAMISEKGKVKPQYRAVAKAFTGKISVKDMTPEEAEMFIDALDRLPEPKYKAGKLVAPTIPRTMKLTTEGFFQKQYGEPTPIWLLRDQTYYATQLGIHPLVEPFERGKMEFDLEFRKSSNLVDRMVNKLNDIAKTSAFAKIKSKVKNIPTEAESKMAELVNRHEATPPGLSEKEEDVFKYFRNLSKDIWRRENEVREKVDLPPIKYKTAYFRHTADAMAKEMLEGKYPFPQGIKYWSEKMVGKKIFNPMEFHRKLSDDLIDLWSKDIRAVTKAMLWSGLKEIYLAQPAKFLSEQLNAISKDLPEYKNLSPRDQAAYDQTRVIPASTRKWLVDYINQVIKGQETELDASLNRIVTKSGLKGIFDKVLSPFGRSVGRKPITNMFVLSGRAIISGVMGWVPRQIMRNSFQPVQNLALYGVKATIKAYLPASVDKNLKELMSESLFLKSYTGFEELPTNLMAKLEKIWLGPYGIIAVNNAKLGMKAAYWNTLELIKSPKFKKHGWADPQRTKDTPKGFLYPSEKEKLLKEMEFGASATQYQYIPIGMPGIFRYKALVPLTRLQSWWMNYFTKFIREALHRGFKGRPSWSGEDGPTLPWSRRVNFLKYVIIGGAILTSLGYKRSFMLGVAPTYLSPAGQLALGMYNYATAKEDWQRKRALNQIYYSWTAFIPGSLAWRDFLAVWKGEKDLEEILFYGKKEEKKVAPKSDVWEEVEEEKIETKSDIWDTFD